MPKYSSVRELINRYFELLIQLEEVRKSNKKLQSEVMKSVEGREIYALFNTPENLSLQELGKLRVYLKEILRIIGKQAGELSDSASVSLAVDLNGLPSPSTENNGN
ncbi:hypothetical protein ACHQM5_001498 [Ranunculus cassubicifolius]